MTDINISMPRAEAEALIHVLDLYIRKHTENGYYIGSSDIYMTFGRLCVETYEVDMSADDIYA